MPSFTNSFLPLVAMLREAESPDLLGPNTVWKVDEGGDAEKVAAQQYFLSLFEQARLIPGLLDDEKLQAIASRSPQTVNEWFTKRGAEIQLTDHHNPLAFYTGADYEQLVEWPVTGEWCSLQGKDGVMYPDAVQISKGVVYYKTPHLAETIAVLPTKGSETVCMVKLATPPSSNDPFTLLKLVQEIEQGADEDYEAKFSGLVFPMVHIDEPCDSSWMKGLWTQTEHGEGAWLAEAKQRSVLKINEKGAFAKSSAGAVIVLRSGSKPPLKMDEPFLFWIGRKDSELPSFIAWIDYPNWQNPGVLTV